MTPRVAAKRRAATKRRSTVNDRRGASLASSKKNHDQVVRAIVSYCELVLNAPATITDAAKFSSRGFWSGSRVRPGWPDLTACLPPDGRMLVVEVKTNRSGKDNKPRDNQERVMSELRVAGALVVVASDLTDFTQKMKGLCNG